MLVFFTLRVLYLLVNSSVNPNI